MIYRLRPTRESFVGEYDELPFEIHFISFDSEQDLTAFLQDDSRLNFIHLKNESIKSTFLVKGKKVS